MGLLANASGSKTQNQSWFSSAVVVPRDCRISLMLNASAAFTNAELQLSTDGGTTWGSIAGAAPAATTTTEIPLGWFSQGTSLQLRHTNVAARTLNRCELHSTG
jgi:hypothetical protein